MKTTQVRKRIWHTECPDVRLVPIGNYLFYECLSHHCHAEVSGETSEPYLDAGDGTPAKVVIDGR